MQKRINRKKYAYTFISILISVIGYIIYSVIEIKDSNVPEHSIQKGDVKEYYWLEKISINDTLKTIRIRIYNDYNGDLALDADFSIPPSMKVDSIFDNINYFEPYKIVLRNTQEMTIQHIYGGYLQEYYTP